jgi:hypothetical protein
MLVLALAVLCLTFGGLTAAAAVVPPTPEPNIATTIIPLPCKPEAGNQQEADWAARDGWSAAEGYTRYPGACQRLRFKIGPIVVKPGQNDVLAQPLTIEQPRYDGWLTRFDPDLVYEDGTVPPIEQLHLHHAVWFTQLGDYGMGPFAASGEEKTILNVPRGYGMPVQAADQWQFLYMVHSAIPQPKTVFITYDIDYIAKDAGVALGLKPAYPVWLDVRPSNYPVFNAQRGFGTGGKCTWPSQNCANFDPWGNVIASQGKPPVTAGTDVTLPGRGQQFGKFANFQGGTLIAAGGHVHPGGLSNDISLVRGGVAKPIFTSEALYWDRTDSMKTGGPPTSWDFSASVAAAPYWGIRVQPGDKLRSNATYDTTIQSVYEAMGIVVTFLAPDIGGAAGAPGVDPFDPAVAVDSARECPSGGLRAAPAATLCLKGWPTHGHLPENDNFGGPSSTTSLSAPKGQETNRVDIAAFVYAPGDLSMISMTGIPTVKLGQSVRFTNEDTFGDIYHSVTSCAYPCLGATGTAFPVANGRSSLGRNLDFDSGELGFGAPTVTAAKNAIGWDLPVTPGNGYQAGEVVTFFCRIHPFMRGAFEVTT